ncbi:hypothetical protein GCM10009851_37880 [Herbiconiux moechotypicola]|uniref:META domain-containing protein n=1 Tax=Herbiconiux moechotypicola TaxID=637393 RepID=A0ABN3E6K6_9MICO
MVLIVVAFFWPTYAADTGGVGAGGSGVAETAAEMPADQALETTALSPAGTGADPAAGLFGDWRMSGAPAEEGDWLRIHSSGLQVVRACGHLGWSFAAADGLLVTALGAGSEACFRGAEGGWLAEGPDQDWGLSLRGYRATETGWELLDATGTVVATLHPPVGPDGSPLASPWEVEGVPLLDDELDDALVASLYERPAPLGDGLVAARADQLLGTWKVVGDQGVAQDGGAGAGDAGEVGVGDDSVATITITPEGVRTRDCHSLSWPGRQGPLDPPLAEPAGSGTPWAGDGSLFLMPFVASDAMACVPTFPVLAGWVRTIAYDEGQLVLFDPAGVELGRLERAG